MGSEQFGNSTLIRSGQRKAMARKNKRRRRRRTFLGSVIVIAAILLVWHFAAPFLADLRLPEAESDVMKSLRALALTDSAIAQIYENSDEYPESLLKLLVSNQETLAFVQNYPNRNSYTKNSGLTSGELSGWIPLFMQWDVRWGYDMYGEDMVAITGCGPTCLAMVAVGLTGDLTADPGRVASFSISRGYCIEYSGTDWGLMTSGAQNYGLISTEVSLWEDNIIQELSAGHPLICAMGPGEFTTTGHFIVICGYENGEFLINDPNSIARSEQRWTYDAFEGQVQNLWAYSPA